jgi:hypothetical protein
MYEVILYLSYLFYHKIKLECFANLLSEYEILEEEEEALHH